MKKEIIKWYSCIGFLEYEMPLVNGLKHGISKQYYPYKQLHWKIPWVNGLIHGCQIEYKKGEYEQSKKKRT